MKFSILCFERCDHSAPKSVSHSRNGLVIWQVLTATIKELSVDAILKHLAQGETIEQVKKSATWSFGLLHGRYLRCCLLC